MIEVLALAGAVTKVATTISAAVKAGKDVGQILPQFGKLAKLEADISLAERGRHKGPLGRLTSTEEEGFAIATAKIKHKEAMSDLRSACRLYGPPGMWDTVVREQAAARKRRKDAIEAQSKKRDSIFWAISVVLGVSVFGCGAFALIYGASKVAEL